MAGEVKPKGGTTAKATVSTATDRHEVLHEYGRERARRRNDLLTRVESAVQDPKPTDLALGRLKTRETELEDRTIVVLRNTRMTRGSKQKANLSRK